MSGASRTFRQQTLPGFSNAISSPESGAGLSRSEWRDGRTLAPYGPARALASLSARQALALGYMTRGTYGRSGDGSLTNADLSPSLASRLRARMDVHGSPEYVLTWTYWSMPSGPPIYALLASERRTLVNVSSGLPAGWPTPAATEARQGYPNRNNGKRGTQKSLTTVVVEAVLAGWATPTAREPGGTPEQFQARKRKAQARGVKMGDSITALSMQAQLAGWATPQANGDGGSRNTPGSNAHAGYSLGDQVRGDSGTGRNGSTAATGRSGALNPDLSRWLMGFPDVWASCGATAMRSSRSSARSSSKP